VKAVDCACRLGAIRGAINCAGIAPANGRGKDRAALARHVRAHGEDQPGRHIQRDPLAATAMSAQPALATGERGVIINTSSVASFEGRSPAPTRVEAGVNA